MADDKREALIDKIHKMRLKAADPASTQGEKEAFLQKVGQLMYEHNIAETELQKEEGHGPVYEQAIMHGPRTIYFVQMAESLARLCNVRLAHYTVLGSFEALGTKLNVESFAEVITHVIQEVNRVIDGFDVENSHLASSKDRKKAFINGVLAAVIQQVNDILSQMKSEGRELVSLELDLEAKKRFGEEIGIVTPPELTPMEQVAMLVGTSIGKGVKIRRDVK